MSAEEKRTGVHGCAWCCEASQVKICSSGYIKQYAAEPPLPGWGRGGLKAVLQQLKLRGVSARARAAAALYVACFPLCVIFLFMKLVGPFVSGLSFSH